MPHYLHFFEGHSRLRFTHLDRLSLVSEIIPASRVYDSNSRRGFSNSYFYRTHVVWNRLPYSLRAINKPSEFKTKLLEHIWKNMVDCDNIISDDEMSD